MRLSRAAHALLACAAPISVCLMLTLGCQRSARDLSLDKVVARQSLSAFLDCWAKGQSAETLQSHAPAIIGRDPAWAAGRRLIGFTIGAETDDGTNSHIATELVLGSERGQDPAETVTYIVGTSPVITIFRNE